MDRAQAMALVDCLAFELRDRLGVDEHWIEAGYESVAVFRERWAAILIDGTRPVYDHPRRGKCPVN